MEKIIKVAGVGLLILFIVAACQLGMFNDATDKIKDKVPNCSISEGCK